MGGLEQVGAARKRYGSNTWATALVGKCPDWAIIALPPNRHPQQAPNPGKRRQAVVQASATGSGRRAVSLGCGRYQPALPVGGKREASADILFDEIREVVEDFPDGHAGSEIVEDIVNGDPHAPDTGLAAALAGLDGNAAVIVRHCRRLLTLPAGTIARL